MARERIVYPRLSPGQKAALSEKVVERVAYKVPPSQTPGLTPPLVLNAMDGKVVLTPRYTRLVRQVLKKSRIDGTALDRKHLAIFEPAVPTDEEPGGETESTLVTPGTAELHTGPRMGPLQPGGRGAPTGLDVPRIVHYDYQPPPVSKGRMVLYGLLAAGILVFDLYLVQQLFAGGPWALYIGFLVSINAVVGLVVTS